MESQPETNNTVPEDQSSPQKPKHTALKKVLFVGLVVLLIFAGIYAAYYWQHNKLTSANRKIDNLTAQLSVESSSKGANSNTATTNANSSSQAVHFVDSVGYPLNGGNGTNKYQVTTKLGVPSFLQAVRLSSTISNQSEGFKIFTDGTFNNEMGRWDLGNPGYSQDNSSGPSEISLIAISNQWLNTTGTTDESFATADSFSFNNPLETPAQKLQYMGQIKSATASCAKIPSKGFSTNDKNLDVCYSFSYGHGAYGVYDPIIILYGYANIDNQPFILSGLINIYDSSLQNASAADKQAANDDALKGNIPKQTAQSQQAILAALKQTTISVVPNPNL